MGTRNGHFRTGFRRGWSEWQKDLDKLAAWAKETGFNAIDLTGGAKPEDVAVLKKHGLDVGSVDALDKELMSVDAGKRKAAVAKYSDLIKSFAEVGAKAFFTVAIPEDGNADRKENHKLAVESFGKLGEVAAAVGGTVVFEGWPGGGHLPNHACTPESLRAIFTETGGKGLGVNFDPSHLIRLGIDPVRFLGEFAGQVKHVHAKDTEIYPEAVYEYGLYAPSIFTKGHGFGGNVWRYTIPGHGITPWTACFRLLEKAGFNGVVSVELEDENFNGSEQGEKDALVASLAYLTYA